MDVGSSRSLDEPRTCEKPSVVRLKPEPGSREP